MVSAERPAPFSVTPSAAERIALLRKRVGKADAVLRLSVEGGGCSGFQYKFEFDDKIDDDDEIVERDGVRVVADSMSLLYLMGCELDYVEDLVGSAFQVRNPNATASCGCGSSFAV